MKTTLNIDQLIDKAVDHIRAQHGFTDAQAEVLDKSVRESVLRYNEALERGKAAYMRFGNDHEVTAIFQRIDRAFEQLAKSKKASKGFLTEKDYQYLLDTAVKVYERNQLDEATAMLAVLAMLEPLKMQHYILLATIIWVQQGVEEANKVYEQFVKIFKDPVLFFYAADCFVHAERTHRAEKLLNEAIELCKHMKGRTAEDLRHKIEAYKSELHHQR